MTAIEIFVEPLELTIAVDGHVRMVANDIAIRTDASGGRQVVAVGEGRPEMAEGDVTLAVLPIFDSHRFDPDVAGAGLRFFILTSVDGLLRLIPYAMGRTVVRLVWPAWPTLPPDARRRFIERAAGQRANLEINGGGAVRQTLFRRLLKRPPRLRDPATEQSRPPAARSG